MATTKKGFFGGSILGLVLLAAPPANVTFHARKPYKGMTTRSRIAGRTAHFFFRLKSFARGNILMDKHGKLNEMRLRGRPNADIRPIPLTVIRSAHFGVEP
ncbi:MAG: hypothetical protein ABSG73_09940 [Candidatus Aminicenantales bacterium]|jgi:hypothetical protein